MEKALISIIVPAYNAQRYIEKCLNSLLEQTYEKIEILVIDDGSKDDTGPICDVYKERDTRIKVFHVENGGVSRARNYGIAEAAGEYIMFVDSDDYVTDDYVETHYHAICEKDADWAITGYYICYPTSQEKNIVENNYCGIYNKKNFGKIFSELYRKYFLNSPWNKIYKKELITKEFCTDMALGEDLRFNLDYLENVQSICVQNGCCYYYMCDEQKESLTKRISKENFSSEKNNYHRLIEWCEKLQVEDMENIQQLYVESIVAMLFTMARKRFTSEEKKEMIGELCQDTQTRSAMRKIKTGNWKSEMLRKLLAKGCERRIIWLLSVVGFV